MTTGSKACPIINLQITAKANTIYNSLALHNYSCLNSPKVSF